MKKSAPQKPGSPSELIDARIRELGEAAQRELCGLRGFVDPFGIGAQLQAESEPPAEESDLAGVTSHL